MIEPEFIAIYATDVKGTLAVECIPLKEYAEERHFVKQFDEYSIETILNAKDESAGIVAVLGLHKMRKMTRSICDTLKRVYDYRCQICGQKIGEQYGSNLIHAHHIDYFMKSMNNDMSNVMIVCPNHHGIIHDMNPIFERKNKTFKYPNGLVEGLALNKHL